MEIVFFLIKIQKWSCCHVLWKALNELKQVVISLGRLQAFSRWASKANHHQRATQLNPESTRGLSSVQPSGSLLYLYILLYYIIYIYLFN